MQRILVRSSVYNSGDRSRINNEKYVSELLFNVHKFTNRPQPDKSRVVIFPALSEFGCETMIPLYCLPYFLQNKYKGYYSIVVGWQDREYLYRHLVDEYWELKEEFQYLREYCRAFHHDSKTLKRFEKKLLNIGNFVTAQQMGRVIVYPKATTCKAKIRDELCEGRVSQFQYFQQCQKCGSKYDPVGLFDDCIAARKMAKWLPSPSKEKMAIAKEVLPKNAVGITARSRKCYGRNLTPEFYERLIWLLQDMGFNPVWLGEKSTTLPSPCKNILDLSSHAISSDLEQTLSYVSNMKFTIQFWTASTRLSGLVGTPFIIFESPDQIWGKGQEGKRLQLTSRGPKKLVVAHFKNVLENNTAALRVVERAVSEVEDGDFSTILGMIENEAAVRKLIWSKRKEITWF